jgi:hypothetical protein
MKDSTAALKLVKFFKRGLGVAFLFSTLDGFE